MAFNAEVIAQASHIDRISRPSQIPAPWQTVIPAGGLDDQDAATITDPTAEIADGGNLRNVLKIAKKGTTLRIRMKYADSLTSITDPKIKVFGRYSATDPWQILKTKDNALNATMTTVLASDVSDGTFNWTTPDPNKHSFDLDGVDEVAFGVETPLAATGDVTTATLEVKVI